MADTVSPFPLGDVEPTFEALRQYWASPIRGHNDMPFWNAFSPSAVAQLSGRLLVPAVFAKPSRFRSSLLGSELEKRYGEDVRDMFLHEAARRMPFDVMESQAEATVQSAKPTSNRRRDYSRILLPMWRDECIGMPLGAAVWR
jgi:hypothetical protein